MLNSLKTFTQALLDLVLPNSCLGCRTGGVALCDECLTQIPPALDDYEPNLRARFSYGHPIIKRALWKFKFKGFKILAEPFGRSLGELILEDLNELETLEGFRAPILIPAPLSRARHRERGFNQAELLANVVSKITGLSVNAELLIKTKNTPSQVSLGSRAARLHNLKNSFSVIDPSRAEGGNFIIIDDVYTTGTTARELMRILTQAGARHTFAYTLAH